jgi:hypothetical protein
MMFYQIQQGFGKFSLCHGRWSRPAIAWNCGAIFSALRPTTYPPSPICNNVHADSDSRNINTPQLSAMTSPRKLSMVMGRQFRCNQDRPPASAAINLALTASCCFSTSIARTPAGLVITSTGNAAYVRAARCKCRMSNMVSVWRSIRRPHIKCYDLVIRYEMILGK